MGNKQSEIFEWEKYFIILQKNFNDNTLVIQKIGNSQQYLGRELVSNDKKQSDEIKRLIQVKYNSKNPYLTKLTQVYTNNDSAYCSPQQKIYLLFEKPSQTLRQQILARKFANQSFSEQQADIILQSGAKAIHYLKQMRHPHNNISTSSIFVDKDRRILLGDPWITPPVYNHDLGQNVFACPSPQKILLQNDQILSICPYKSDLFSLGTVVLEALNFQHMDILYEKGFRKVLQNRIQQKLMSVKNQNLRYKLSILLSHDPQNRDEIYHMYRNKNPLSSSQIGKNKVMLSNNETQKQMNKKKLSKVYNTEAVYKQKAPNFVGNNNIQTPSTQKYRILSTQQNPKTFASDFNPQKDSHSYPSLPLYPYNFNFQQKPNNYEASPVVHPPQNVHFQYATNMLKPNFNYLQPTQISKPLLNQNNKYISNIPHNLMFQVSATQTNQKPMEIINGKYSKTNILYNAPNIQKTINPQNENTVPTNKIQAIKVEQGLKQSTENIVKTSGTYKFTENLTSENSRSKQISNLHEPTETVDHNSNYEIKNRNSVQKTPVESFEVLAREDVNQSNINRKTGSDLSDKIFLDSINQTQNQINALPTYNTELRSTPQRRPTRKYNSTIKQDPDQNSYSGQKNTDDEYQFVIEQYEAGKYEGQKKNGMRNGYGKFYYNQGSVYDGNWKDNLMHGKGNLYYSNGRLAYEGEWRMDEFHGYGKVYNQDQLPIQGCYDYTDLTQVNDYWASYEGELNSDRRHGKGKIKFSNGEVFSGIFVSDAAEGEGKFYTSKGDIIHGIWKNNKLIKKL